MMAAAWMATICVSPLNASPRSNCPNAMARMISAHRDFGLPRRGTAVYRRGRAAFDRQPHQGEQQCRRFHPSGAVEARHCFISVRRANALYAGGGARAVLCTTPARLKFLKSARSEDLATLDIVKRQAMARPDVAFTLTMDGRRALVWKRGAIFWDPALQGLPASAWGAISTTTPRKWMRRARA